MYKSHNIDSGRNIAIFFLLYFFTILTGFHTFTNINYVISKMALKKHILTLMIIQNNYLVQSTEPTKENYFGADQRVIQKMV